jgi:hypothetical protein
MKRIERAFLGDGVYAHLDERGLVLTTSNGERDTNTIVLEPSVLHALEFYVEQMRRVIEGRPHAPR